MKRLLQAIGITAMLGLVVVLVVAVENSRSKDAFVKSVAAGRLPAAPAFDLPALSGSDRVRLADHKGKIVVVQLLGLVVRPVQGRGAAARHDGGRAGEGRRGVRRHRRQRRRRRRPRLLEAFGLDYAQAHDGEGKEKDRFGVTGFPETFVIDREGRAVEWFPGQIDADGLRAAIAKADQA